MAVVAVVAHRLWALTAPQQLVETAATVLRRQYPARLYPTQAAEAVQLIKAALRAAAVRVVAATQEQPVVIIPALLEPQTPVVVAAERIGNQA